VIGPRDGFPSPGAALDGSGGAESLLKAVSFKKATEGMGRGRVTNARWQRVPDCGGCNTKTTGGGQDSAIKEIKLFAQLR